MSCAQRDLHPEHGQAPWECFYCGNPVTCSCPALPGAARKAQVDHLVPVARGGSRAGRNVVPSCASCNASKGMAVWPDEWTPGTGLVEEAVGAKIYGAPAQLTPNALYVLEHLRSRGEQDFTLDGLIRGRPLPLGRDAIRSAVGLLARNGLVQARVRHDPAGGMRVLRRIVLHLTDAGVGRRAA